MPAEGPGVFRVPAAGGPSLAVARGEVVMSPATLALVRDSQVAKGDVLSVAQVAGIMAAKRTGDLIPMCHPLPLTHISVDFRPDEAHSSVEITATVRTSGKTGVEMEALTAAAVAGLTLYDMCKAVDRTMRISDLRVTLKEAG